MDNGQVYISLMAPRELVEAVNKAAKKDKRTRSAFIRIAMEERLERITKEQLKQSNSTE